MNFGNYSEALQQQIDALQFFLSQRGQVLHEWRHENWATAIGEAVDFEDTVQPLFQSVIKGETYYWSKEICALLQGSAASLPNWTLTPEGVPASNGFFWFASPLSLPPLSGNGQVSDLTAISWAWNLARDQMFLAAYVKDPLRPAGVPFLSLLWGSGSSLLQAIAAGKDSTERARSELQLRYFAAACTFIEQRILCSTPQIPNRATRRSLPPTWQPEPLVRVIELRRRATSADHDGEHDSVEWSCQWIVRGHWRQQWCPKANAHQPRWIMPYVKGPENKPLKPPRATVFAVVR